MTLALFLMYEIGRGKKSYWYPYLVSMPTVRFSCFWSHEEIMHIQDKAILERMIEYRKSLRKEWKDFSIILKKNYKVFPLHIINEGLFYNVYA